MNNTNISDQVLKQENFSLRRQFQVSEECNKSYIHELLLEVSELRDSQAKQNIKQQVGTGFWEVESTRRENELREQVHRQGKQMAEYEEREKNVMKEMRRMKENMKIEKNDEDLHLDYIQSLKTEISQYILITPPNTAYDISGNSRWYFSAETELIKLFGMQGNTDQGYSFKYFVPYMFLLLGDDFWCGLEFELASF